VWLQGGKGEKDPSRLQFFGASGAPHHEKIEGRCVETRRFGFSFPFAREL
jgi:hypothetical protein